MCLFKTHTLHTLHQALDCSTCKLIFKSYGEIQKLRQIRRFQAKLGKFVEVSTVFGDVNLFKFITGSQNLSFDIKCFGLLSEGDAVFSEQRSSKILDTTKPKMQKATKLYTYLGDIKI